MTALKLTILSVHEILEHIHKGGPEYIVSDNARSDKKITTLLA